MNEGEKKKDLIVTKTNEDFLYPLIEFKCIKPPQASSQWHIIKKRTEGKHP
jgi:hypothetical protein